MKVNRKGYQPSRIPDSQEVIKQRLIDRSVRLSENPDQIPTEKEREKERLRKYKEENAKPQMRLRHPSYHKFWKDLGELDLKTFRIAYRLVMNKQSSFSAIERELVRRKGAEYEKLGILSVKVEDKVENQTTIENGVQ